MLDRESGLSANLETMIVLPQHPHLPAAAGTVATVKAERTFLSRLQVAGSLRQEPATCDCVQFQEAACLPGSVNFNFPRF